MGLTRSDILYFKSVKEVRYLHRLIDTNLFNYSAETMKKKLMSETKCRLRHELMIITPLFKDFESKCVIKYLEHFTKCQVVANLCYEYTDLL